MWRGCGPVSKAEGKALRTVRQAAAADATPDGIDLHLASNFNVGSQEYDLCLLGPSGAVIGEIKNYYYDRVVARQNRWQLVSGSGTKVIQGHTPFNQCNVQRSKLWNAIDKYALETRGHKHGNSLAASVKAGVVFTRDLEVESVGLHEPWFYMGQIAEWWPRAVTFACRRAVSGFDDPRGFLDWLGLEELPAAQAEESQAREAIVVSEARRDESASAAEVREREQLAAIEAPFDRHLVVVAGPGAGKTRVMANRVGHLIASGVPETEIAVVTHTNSARDEIRMAIAEALGSRVPETFVGTIHQLALQILGLIPGATRPRVCDPKTVSALFRQRVAPEAVPQAFEDLKLQVNAWDGNAGHPLGDPHAARWARLQRELHAIGRASFESLLEDAIQVLERGDVRAGVCKHLVVDEFQDVTGLQARLLRQMVNAGTVVHAVGDPAQSIFGFAGALKNSLSQFERRFGPCERQPLRTNSRSLPGLVEAFSALRDAGDPLGPQVPVREPGDCKLRLVGFPNEGAQARWIAKRIQECFEDKIAPEEICVLQRSHFPQAIGRELTRAGIAFHTSRKGHYEQRPHVRRLLAYLAAADPNAGRAELLDLVYWLPATSDRVGECIAGDLRLEQLEGAYRSEWERGNDIREELRAAGRETSGSSLVRRIWERTMEPFLSFSERREAEQIEEDVRTLEVLAAQVPGPGDLVTEVYSGAVTEEDRREGVLLGTIHYAKGREWKVVFLADLTAGVLPDRRAADQQEERRLLYVGATRAKDRLYLCAPDRIAGRGEGASPFLEGLSRMMAVERIDQ